MDRKSEVGLALSGLKMAHRDRTQEEASSGKVQG